MQCKCGAETKQQRHQVSKYSTAYEDDMAQNEIAEQFEKYRHCSAHHLGMGDIRLSVGEQEEIAAMMACRTIGTAPEVTQEIERATEKVPTWPTDPLHALAVLGEEYGELNKAMLQRTYEPFNSSRADVRIEAIQTAAMALRLVASLDEYEYRICEQHNQPPAQFSHPPR